MRKLMLIGLLTGSLAMAGIFALASTQESATSPDAGTKYVCPLTGEELPCPACCPVE